MLKKTLATYKFQFKAKASQFYNTESKHKKAPISEHHHQPCFYRPACLLRPVYVLATVSRSSALARALAQVQGPREQLEPA